MEADSTDDHMVAVTAKVPRDFKSQIDELTSDDQPRSQVIRNLIRDSLRRKENSLRLRLVSIAIFLGIAGLPVGLAANGSVNEAIAFLVVIAALDFVQSLRGGQTFIRI
jgi:Arc/MetJ-type ribon-helix-helix transcriptional regulator